MAVVDFEFIHDGLRGLGVNREAGGQPGDGGPWAIAGTSLSGGRAGQIRMAFTRWEAPRRRGDAILFSGRSSSTEDSVVVTTLYAFNINLANSSPPAGLCNRDQCVLSTPEPGVKSADA